MHISILNLCINIDDILYEGVYVISCSFLCFSHQCKIDFSVYFDNCKFLQIYMTQYSQRTSQYCMVKLDSTTDFKFLLSLFSRQEYIPNAQIIFFLSSSP